MVCLELLRDDSRVLELVVLALVEADRKCLDRARGLPGHERNDGARIDATAKERAKGNITDEPYAHGLTELRDDCFGGFRLGELYLLVVRAAPIALRPNTV